MSDNKDGREQNLYSLDEKFTEAEIKILKSVIERERAIWWLSNSMKYVAGWIVIVFGAWALFSKTFASWIANLLGYGPLE